MLKYLLFLSLIAFAIGVEIYNAPVAYVAPNVFGIRHTPAVVPFAYARAFAPSSAVETYNSVQTPDSFQQQYRTDYKPVTYEYLY